MDGIIKIKSNWQSNLSNSLMKHVLTLASFSGNITDVMDDKKTDPSEIYQWH